MKYLVNFKETREGKIVVNAKSAEEAKDIAFDIVDEGNYPNDCYSFIVEIDEDVEEI